MMKSKTLAITLGTVVALGALGGVSYAAIPNSTNGTITACYATSGTAAGTLKVIDAQSGATCAVGQNQIAWPSKSWSYKGTWTNATSYAVNDVVLLKGNSYVAKVPSANSNPSTNPAIWGLIASKGAPGTNGISGYQTISGTTTTVSPGNQNVAIVSCPAGLSPISGGESNTGGYNSVVLTDSYPIPGGWKVYVNNVGDTAEDFTPHVICATVS